MNTATLNELYRARVTARAGLKAAKDYVDRARRLSAAASERVAKAESYALRAETVEAERLVALIASDGPTMDCRAGIDPDLVAELNAARRDASINVKVIAALDAAVTQATVECKGAEAAVIVAVDTLLCDEDIEEARQITHLMDEVDRRGRAFLHLSVANEMNGRRPPHEVTNVLARLDAPLLDRRTVAINLIKYGDQAAANRCEIRRASLIAGDAIEEDAAA
jgi:hypothetical protein